MTERGSPPHKPIAATQLQHTAAMFGMLSATARLQIIWLLSDGERDVGTLAAEVGQSLAAVSQHLAKLKLAGLVRARKDGRRQVYLVTDPEVAGIVERAMHHHRPREDRATSKRGRRFA